MLEMIERFMQPETEEKRDFFNRGDDGIMLNIKGHDILLVIKED